MIPFNVDKDWYENYWLRERKDLVRRPVVRALMRSAIRLYKEWTASVGWINLHRQRALDLEMLLTFGDRELWDLGLNRADIPSVIAGTYSRDGAELSKTVPTFPPALSGSHSVSHTASVTMALTSMT